MRTVNTLIGQPMERTEDLRLVRGRGTFVSDIFREGQLHAVIVRSGIAHGRLRKIDTTAALKLPGVRAVLTAGDLGTPAPRVPLRLQPLPQLEPFHQPMLATDKVRYVGEPVAVVIADTQAIAEDAHDLVEIDVEPLPAVIGKDKALEARSQLFEVHGSNVALTWCAAKGDAGAAFAKAEYTRKATFYVQRHAAMFMEPRGFVAEWDAETSKMTVWGAAKVAFTNRKILANAMGLPEAQVHLIELDVGGGFGSRGEFYPEDYLIPFAARHLGRPVKWVEDRREHLMCANHARDVTSEIEIACTKDGRFLAIRGHSYFDNGAYLRTNGSVGPRNVAQFVTGPYRIDHVDLKTSMMMTNKTPSGTYRAPGRFESDFIRERLIDMVARDLGIDRVELRRRNLVTDAEMPYPLASITPYDSETELDSGDNHELLTRTLEDFRWEEKARLSGKLIDGRYHGVALGCFIEGGAAGPSEDARMVLESDGTVTLYIGSAGVGQGIETIFAQIAGDALELPFDKVRVLHGSTDHVTNGYGSYHSRSTVMGGSAILVVAEALKDKIRAAAASALGCQPAQVTIDGDRVRGPGARSLSFAELAKTPIEAESTYKQHAYTYAYGTECAHVAVDPGTGHVEVLEIASIKDVGRMINPLTLWGQGIGSMVQGLGGTFLEDLVYDENGQLLTGSFADYLLPTADQYPNLRAQVIELKPSPTNPLGAKGGGEGEIVPVGGVIANAVADALRDFKVEPNALPLSPPKVWAMLQAARK